LFTPVAWGDSDGFFNLWYKTNLTDGSLTYSDVSATSTNPVNPNNPDMAQVWPSTGWQLWQANLPTTASTNLKVSELGLAEGEHITALRFEYGSVEIGFTTLNGSLTALQSDKPSGRSTSIDWTPLPTDRFYSAEAALASGLRPATYLVTCPQGLLPPEVISSSVSAHIARNLVLTEEDSDDVATTVIQPFTLPPDDYAPRSENSIAHWQSPYSYGPYTSPRLPLPRTGDASTLMLGLVGITALLAGSKVLAGAYRRRRQSRDMQTLI
jgi:LPXTG-motif cell wall-anchored protein